MSFRKSSDPGPSHTCPLGLHHPCPFPIGYQNIFKPSYTFLISFYVFFPLFLPFKNMSPLGMNSFPSQYRRHPLNSFVVMVSLALKWCKIMKHFGGCVLGTEHHLVHASKHSPTGLHLEPSHIVVGDRVSFCYPCKASPVSAFWVGSFKDTCFKDWSVRHFSFSSSNKFLRQLTSWYTFKR